METSHNLVSIQHWPETTHSHDFWPGHTPCFLHKNTATVSSILLQLHTLLALPYTNHANRSYHRTFPNPYMPRIYLSHLLILFTHLPYGKHLVHASLLSLLCIWLPPVITTLHMSATCHHSPYECHLPSSLCMSATCHHYSGCECHLPSLLCIWVPPAVTTLHMSATCHHYSAYECHLPSLCIWVPPAITLQMSATCRHSQVHHHQPSKTSPPPYQGRRCRGCCHLLQLS